MEKPVKLCGMWKKNDKNGNEMFSGKLSPYTTILMFKNKFKNKESDPDYHISIANITPDDKKEAPRAAPIQPCVEDDLPF